MGALGRRARCSSPLFVPGRGTRGVKRVRSRASEISWSRSHDCIVQFDQVKTVFVTIPEGIPEAEPEELNKPRPFLPSFAEPTTLDAEIVQQKPAPKAPRGKQKAITPELVVDPVSVKK